MTSEDILRFRMVSDVQLSPAGDLIAFTLTEQDGRENRQSGSLWVVPADASAPPRRLTAGPRDGRPRWSPDGGRLAFLSARDREWARDVYVLDMAGGEARQVASLPRGAGDLAWSPDGTRLGLVGQPAYPQDPDREPVTDGEQLRARYQERVRHIQRFKYRLDGVGQLDDEASQLWIVELAGDEPRMITEGPTDVVRPRWVAGDLVAFLGSREPDHDYTEAAEIYAVPALGGEVRRLTSYGRAMSAFGIGPQGTPATVRTDTADAFGGSHARLWIGGECVTRELDRTSTPAVLADTLPGREALDPIWAGGHCYFDVGDRGSVHIYRAQAGGPPQLVLGGERVVGSVSIAGGRMAFTSTATDDALSIRVAGLDGGGERVVWDPNPWLQDAALGEVRRLDFEHDGGAVDAWVLLPPGHREGDLLPSLLYIHGGPHAAYGWAFQFVFQVLAGAGYAVVYCNPPGSQTYSEQYATRLRGRWGELDFPYLMALTDRALAAGFADPDRLGVGGASYGGFATLWVVTHTNRFKAAVAARPVAGLLGFYGSSDVGWSFGAGALGSEPWEDGELYRRLSPATHLADCNTPLRLIASTGDLRTPLEQAEQVFVRLRKMRKPVDMVVFHGEPHGMVVQGRPWNRVRHMRAVLEWFDRHLAPGVA